jgi:hypothetical protein
VDIVASNAAPVPHAGGAGAVGGINGPDSGVTLADSAALTSAEDGAAARSAGAEQAVNSIGTTAHAARVRWENRLVTIRTCFHDLGPSQTEAASVGVSHARFTGMTRFVVPAAASVVVGLLLGAASVFGATLMIQQDTKPAIQPGDPASSVLNRVEYGNRG